ncbi:MAG: PDZ domain-containing protein [Clostridia bacterium]|nr:PDZ domain-containing protein [Clostridia bacterium]
MSKQRNFSRFSLLIVCFLLFSVLLSSCAFASTDGILKEKADAIDSAMRAALSSLADTFTQRADAIEAGTETPTDEEGNPITDTAAYLTFLREGAAALRALPYDAYNLAILDDVYRRSYVGSYEPMTELCADMAALLAYNFKLAEITDKETATEILYACYMFAVGDVYGAYVSEEDAKQEQAGDDSYVGIGVTVTQLANGYVEVIAVTPDSPAKAAGIAEGDVLIAVEGESVLSLGYDKTVDRVRGVEGTSVSLTFLRGDTEYTVSVSRKKLVNLTVSYKILANSGGTTGYIRINQFEATTFTQFVAAVEALEAQGVTEFVFDVRNNPGGRLESVLGILDYIVPDDKDLPLIRMEYAGETVSYDSVESYLTESGADEELLARYASAKNHSISARMSVLCNAYTASAGELFTSCLKDFGVAEVFGVTTYGKGVGQSGFAVTDFYAYLESGRYYYTVDAPGYFRISAFYYSPPVSDNYNSIGVLPHHVVELTDEAKEYHVTNIPESVDNQLAAALAFVKSDAPLSPAPSPTPPAETPDGGEQGTEPPAQNGALPNENGGEQDGGSSVVVFFVLLGVLVGIGAAISAYFIWESVRRRKEDKEKSENFFRQSNPGDNNDHNES